ncbi:penicillin-binding protein 2 [Synechococcus sp. CS-602]|uniref:peptidoglycan D,D-transpeptidase FtsI family protein n=1 Tax=Synechococcaceae TaxID=1890426 RepID=UPI0009F8A1A8|nr:MULTISPECIES: penicillin-binding protein 2 [Synechococcaceae]MCT4365753.1 penicillin-binding protein 2 [Candidatus Regnicoccus frigidus MAG-AL1]MCT0201927.1 penicillin-binding protein 2 [Synechococcus sp. CS-603]MCT0205517.1 penicillin-binding protein 2 [Synechococcus sp. CS-602]MCT0246946.1 penicillin-binding protein 2 [Synechococcus sp. CS-601]MCT4366473.1 penicillin-binding protein 2 [Candidatus Regnicoccus frigidus MAG-AL2]
MATALVGLSIRLAWLQVKEGDQLQARARAIQTQQVRPIGKRRQIIDRQGTLVALDEERFTLWAHPRYFNFPGDDPTAIRGALDVAEKLSEVMALPASDLTRTMGSQRSGIKLATDLDGETAERIRDLGISGLDLEAFPQRIYPQGQLFANVVGFLNQDRVAQAGLEQSRDKEMWRQESARSMKRGADGTPLPAGLEAGVLYTDDLRLQLTLDTRLQQVAYQALTRQLKEWKAKRGVAMVMDVRNGEMLALASAPTYNPNRFWDFSPALFREWSVQDLYEPGSTFKPINLAIALQEKAVKPSDKINDSGSLMIGGWPIFNHDRRANGVIDFPTILQVSSNVAMVQTMRQVKPSHFWQWLERIGIDTVPDTDLPGAVAGQLKSRQQFTSQPIEPATASFGQGFSLTPLKLLQLHGMLANDGKLVSPHITRGLRSGDALAGAAGPGEGIQLLDPAVTRQVMGWMETVVEASSGDGVKVEGYRIGGKTGTAQKALNGVYIPGARICSFVASLPIDDPRYVVLVVVDEPQGGNAYGSTVAMPAAREIIESLLVIEKVPPSKPKVRG